MKASLVALVALSAPSALAVPHVHRHQHRSLHDRDVLAYVTTMTSTVTVTEPSVVVWVDAAGNVVSTETRGQPAETAPPAVPALPAPAATTQAPIAQPPAPSAPPAPVKSSDGGDLAGGGNPGSQGNQGNYGIQSGSAASGFGICYDMIDSSTQCKSASTVDSDFAFLAGQGYTLIRTYDIGCDVGVIAEKAAAHGMKLFAGINGIDNIAGDLDKLISYLSDHWDVVDTVNIGNEQISAGKSVAQITGAVDQGRTMLKQAGYGGKVVTVDVFSNHRDNPGLSSNSDYLAANAHSFFDTSIDASQAGSWVQNTVKSLQSAAGGKSVVITESGWPHQGNSNGAARPALDEQSRAVSGIRQAFSGNPSSVFLFQAYDAGYKGPGALGVEQFFGIYGH